MSDVRTWSQTPASNNSAVPDGWPESQAPSSVNNCAREMMASHAELLADTQTAITTGGTSTAYTVTIAQDPASYAEPLGFYVQFHTASGAAPTMNVNALGAKSLKWPNGTALIANDVATNQYAFVYYDGTDLIVYTSSAASANATELNNRLINGEFCIWQRGTSVSAQADDTYGGMGDRWYILTQTGTIAGARQANPFDGARNSGQLTQSQAVAQRIGAAQIIEGQNCVDLRGQAVTFYGRFKISADQDVRVSILEWTGTENSVTSDVVNDWASTDYTDGAAKFFVDANFTPSVTKEYALPGTGWVDFFTTATLGSTFTNLVVFLWTEGTAAQNVTLSMANCGFIRGSLPPSRHTARQFTEELALCRRYYAKTFAIDTAPAQNASETENAFNMAQAVAAATAEVGFQMPLQVEMRAAPTVVLYNPSAANAQARNIDFAGADCSGTGSGASTRAIRVAYTSAAGSAAGHRNAIHITADAEL